MPITLFVLCFSPFSLSNIMVLKPSTANAAHLMVNLYALSSVGRIVENLFGQTRMLGIYLASGIAGNVLGLFMQVYCCSFAAAVFTWAVIGIYLF